VLARGSPLKVLAVIHPASLLQRSRSKRAAPQAVMLVPVRLRRHLALRQVEAIQDQDQDQPKALDRFHAGHPARRPEAVAVFPDAPARPLAASAAAPAAASSP
jgi:hypothetical protein